MRILLVDDEPQIIRALSINLRARGHTVHAAPTGAAALDLAARHPVDLILLDLGLPDLDGVQVIEGLRGWTPVPIIVLSGRTGSADKVGALDAGADDYLTKPFGMDELLARIRAVTRRADTAPPAAVVPIGAHQVDFAAHRATGPDGGAVRLTPTEWSLLEILVRSPGKLVPGHDLLRAVWGEQYTDEGAYLRFHFGQLRRKLEADPARPRHLITEPGIGYRFEP